MDFSYSVSIKHNDQTGVRRRIIIVIQQSKPETVDTIEVHFVERTYTNISEMSLMLT